MLHDASAWMQPPCRTYHFSGLIFSLLPLKLTWSGCRTRSLLTQWLDCSGWETSSQINKNFLHINTGPDLYVRQSHIQNKLPIIEFLMAKLLLSLSRFSVVMIFVDLVVLNQISYKKNITKLCWCNSNSLLDLKKK